MDQDAPVVVIGAGPCGLAIAGMLLRQGIPVRVFESAAAPSQGSRAVLLWPSAQAVLADLDVLAGVQALASKPGALNYFGDQGRLARVRLSQVQVPLVVPQRHTDTALEAAVLRAAGTIERSQRLIAVVPKDQGAEVVLRDSSGREIRVFTPWLIGADGVRSTVREQLGIAFTGAALPTRFALAEGKLTGALRSSDISYYLTSRGVLLIAALPDDQVRVAGDVPPDLEVAQECIQDLLDTRGPQGLRMKEMNSLTTFTSAERMAERMRQGRAFLVGDAAHTHSPFGGQGLNLGLQDVRNLAWKLAGVISGRLDPAILDTYDPERRAAAQQVTRTTGAMIRISLARPPWSLLRDVMIRTAERTGILQSWYVPLISGRRIRYPGALRRVGRLAPDWANSLPDRYVLVTSGPACSELSSAATALTRRRSAVVIHNHVTRQRTEFLLVRPDGYVAARGRTKHLDRAERLLAALSSTSHN